MPELNQRFRRVERILTVAGTSVGHRYAASGLAGGRPEVTGRRVGAPIDAAQRPPLDFPGVGGARARTRAAHAVGALVSIHQTMTTGTALYVIAGT
jgi:hypothetical protein